MAGATVRRDDPRSGFEPAWPGGVDRGARTDVSIGEDDDLHPAMLTVTGPGPM